MICSLFTFLAISGPPCPYQPPATETVRIVDTASDLRSCRRLGQVSPPVTTTPGFVWNLQAMLQYTVAMGGTDLLLNKRSHDWLVASGVAYDCNPVRTRERAVVRAAG